MTARNYNQSTIDIIADIKGGIFVRRAAAALAAALTPIFTVSGGAILLTMLFGKVSVASGANNVHIEATPTAGTAAQVIAANLDIDPAVVGDYIVAPLTGSGALTYGGSATGCSIATNLGILVPVGTIDYHAAAAEGTVAWTICYIPLEAGASVAAT